MPAARFNRRTARQAIAPLVAAAAFLTLTPGLMAQGASPAEELADQIRSRIDAAGSRAGAQITVGSERLHAATQLPRFYHGRGYEAAWVNEAGPRPAADSLLAAIEAAFSEGLEADHYHLPRMREIHGDLRRARMSGSRPGLSRLVDLDLLMTDAFLMYASHLVSGRVDPTSIHPEWTESAPTADLVATLDMALATGRIGETIEALLPTHPGYQRLRAALAEYRQIAAQGGWPQLPGRTLGPGDRDPAVALLRERLRLTNDLRGPWRGANEQLYDAEVEAAVRRFQARHFMEQDGVVRLETSAHLNVPVEYRIRQLERNLERWRWLPTDLGDRHIIVNIAGFEMHVMEGDSSIFRSRVLVGQRYRKTPVFSDRMTYLVLNPTWTIPPGILEEDKLPLIRRDPGYLARNNITVLAADGRTVNPSTIDFNGLTGRTGLRFRMEPGPENPLGRVKFMFPNQHHIYLHDTPDHDDFDAPWGAVSSGCIRVERSMDLAELLLADAPGWTRQRIETAASAGPAEQHMPLRRPLPIHILYWTAWVEPDGTVQFRSDVYDRDGPLDEALRAPPPSANGSRSAS
jgi:L,D-transpeptidase YcbB